MKALILAGGFGTRLRPLTNTRPKHLLPIANRLHVEHVFDLLLAQDVREVVLATSYLAHHFDEVVERAATRGLEFRVTVEKEALGTAGAIKYAASELGPDRFLVFNGDILTDVDLGTFVSFHEDRGAELSILLTPVEDPSAFGVVPTDVDGRIQAFIEKPPRDEAPTNLINAGIYVMEPSVLDRIPAGEVWSAERQLFPGLVEEGAPCYAMGTDAYWMDIGTPEKYLQANVDALTGRFKTDAVPSPGPQASVIAADAKVAEEAVVKLSSIGAGAVVEAGAVIDRSILLPFARVEAGAELRDSIMGEASVVTKASQISEEVLEDGYVVDGMTTEQRVVRKGGA
jgi:mannose-1-phosphate guanylyltransferase